MTLSFHKVKFNADEVLDLVQECLEEPPDIISNLERFEIRFTELAEERSRE